MDGITLGEVGIILTFVVGFISSAKFLVSHLNEWVCSAVEKGIEPIQEHLREVDLENCKNYLVSYLAQIEKNQPVDVLETQRFWEEFQHYEKIGGNSYIKEKVEKLKVDGKLSA